MLITVVQLRYSELSNVNVGKVCIKERTDHNNNAVKSTFCKHDLWQPQIQLSSSTNESKGKDKLKGNLQRGNQNRQQFWLKHTQTQPINRIGTRLRNRDRETLINFAFHNFTFSIFFSTISISIFKKHIKPPFPRRSAAQRAPCAWAGTPAHSCPRGASA